MRLPGNIDVCIPVYNDEKYIARAIHSCLEQEDVDTRVLVSDNCSTDQTYEIIKKIAANDTRVIVSRNKENIGMVGNTRQIIDAVKRPYYMFLCSDDYLLDRRAFASALELFEKHSDLISVYSNLDFMDPEGNVILTNTFNRDEIFDASDAMRSSLITTRNRFGIPILHRTEYAKRHPFLEEAPYSTDIWHSFKVGSYGKCGHINRSCIGNTYTGNNLSRDLMSNILSELRFLADLEQIKLTRIEKICQRYNYVKTLIAKFLFFKLIVPLKSRLNSRAA